MKKSIGFAALAAVLCLQSGAAAAVARELPGDITTALFPITAYGITLLRHDPDGGREFLRSTSVSLVVNSALRLAFNQTELGKRPNGNGYGFPSGHTGFVTSCASFLQDRYGWKYGVPAYLAAGYVAWVRVDTNHHRWRDVAAGAAVSFTISKFFVTPLGATQIAPIIGPDWLGFRIERSF